MTGLPNIVFIMADDMGYGDLGCYNPDSSIPTPNMDKLAAEGLRFTDAHSSSSVCTPSRYSVITGRYCWRTSVSEGVIGGYSPPLIEPERPTVASLLKKQGYHTACIGKWHIGSTFHDKAGAPTDREDKVDFTQPVAGGPTALGFDYAYYNAGCGTCAPPYGFIKNDRFVGDSFFYYDCAGIAYDMSSGMMAKGWVTRDADVIIAKKATAYIEERAKSKDPFFLYLAPNAPHEPCAEATVPEFARGKSKAGHRGDLVWLFDWIVGQVVETLEKTGQAENTLLIVTSDNGALPGDSVFGADGKRVLANRARREFEYACHGHKSCGDLRGYKAHIWEGGHREPLIARWPGKIAPNAISDQLICLSDFMATCAAIAGSRLPSPSAEDSYDMLPVFLGKADRPVRDALVHHSSFGVFSVRQGNWKAIFDCADSGGWPTPRGTHPQPGSPGQLYDIGVDPAEQHNLWSDRQDVVSRLSDLLDRYKETGRSAPSPSKWVDAEDSGDKASLE